MRSRNRTTVCVTALIAVSTFIFATLPSRVPASPISSFSQLPMLNTPLVDDIGLMKEYHGHDELSTAWTEYERGATSDGDFSGISMSDDFASPAGSPVVGLRWWGSYLNGPLQGVDRFIVTFSADVPTGTAPDSFSHPGTILHSQVVTRGAVASGSGTFSEQQIYPLSVDGPIYEYNAMFRLGQEFVPQPDTIYWLTVAALVDLPSRKDPLTDPSVIRWGWHNRDYTIQDLQASTPPEVTPGEFIDGTLAPNVNIWHFQDDAVRAERFAVELGKAQNGIVPSKVFQGQFAPQDYLPFADGPRAIGTHSKDLAFELYSVPEPGSICLCCIGLTMVIARFDHRRS